MNYPRNLNKPDFEQLSEFRYQMRRFERFSEQAAQGEGITPLQYLLFAAGAPDILVMTSANRSSEPIAYTERDAFERLDGVADAFLAGIIDRLRQRHRRYVNSAVNHPWPA